MPDKTSPEQAAFNRAKTAGETVLKTAGFTPSPGPTNYPCPAGFEGGTAWWRILADNVRAHAHVVRLGADGDVEERKHLEQVVARHGFRLKG